MSETVTWSVPLSDIRVDDELLAAGRDAIASGWWSMGPRVAELEDRFGEVIETRHAFAVANGTAALHLALLAIGCGPGDEVVLPSLNFVAAANTVVRVGAVPVFCDIVGEHDLNLDPADLEAAIGPKTKAVIVLHYAGFACDMAAVLDCAERHGLAVIEDAAHAPGARWEGRPLGSIGSVGCFSFFSNKNIPVGEGGMVVTSDDDVATRIRSLRSHGMTTLTWQRHKGHASSYDVVDAGFNFRLDELRAGLALVQLARLEANNGARRAHATRYRSLLDGVQGIALPFAGDTARETSAHHLVVAVVPPGIDRDEVRAGMQQRRVQTSLHYPPIHRFTHYARIGSRGLPVTEAVGDRLITLPLFPHMTGEQVDEVAGALIASVAAADTPRSVSS
jgi:dTDP-4-amino-4,6-dideoxygalactose transaminase